jgi:hypothetical protein
MEGSEMATATNGKVTVPIQNYMEREMKTVQILCTPQMAEGFLKGNCKNRPVSGRRVAYFVRQIFDGGWALTHQGIAFWDDGTLADGQHRLLAIVKAGIPVPVLMTTGLPKPAIHAIDMGRARSTSDVLHFVGMSVTKNWVAAAKILYQQREMARSGNTVWPQEIIPTERMAAFIAFAHEALEFGALKKKGKGLSHASFHAALAAAWFTQDREKLARFKTLVADGLEASQDESAAIRLRDFLMTTHLTNGGEGARRELFQRCCTALRAFLEGRGITKLYCRADAVFAIPDGE